MIISFRKLPKCERFLTLSPTFSVLKNMLEQKVVQNSHALYFKEFVEDALKTHIYLLGLFHILSLKVQDFQPSSQGPCFYNKSLISNRNGVNPKPT